MASCTKWGHAIERRQGRCPGLEMGLCVGAGAGGWASCTRWGTAERQSNLNRWGVGSGE